MPSKLHGLPRRTPLQDGESLHSLLERLAQLNFYPRSSYLVEILERHAAQPSFTKSPLSFDAGDFIHLGQLAGIEPSELIRASDHRFAPAILFPSAEPGCLILPDGRRIAIFKSLGFAIWRRQRTPFKFCPQCLSENSYHRLIWLPGTTAACVNHQCLLADRCPQCQSALSIKEIVEHRCGTCRTSLTSFTTPSVSSDPIGLLAESAIQRWALGLPAADLPQEYRTIGKYSEYALYQFVRGVRHSLHFPKTDQGSFLKLAQNSIVQINLTFKKWESSTGFVFNKIAFECFKDWPNGFHKFLETYRVQPHSYSSGLNEWFGVLHSVWINRRWQHPKFKFIQNSFDEFLIKGNVPPAMIVKAKRVTKNPELRKRFRYWGKVAAAKNLKISMGTLNRLLRLGKLNSCLLNPQSTYQPAFDPEAIRSLKARWGNGIALQETMELLGAAKEMVRNLARIGAIRAVRGTAVDMSQEWLFDRQSVQDFFVSLETRSRQVVREDRALLTLAESAKSLACVGLNAAAALNEIANSRYWVYINPQATRFISNLLIPTRVVECLRQDIVQRNGWVSLHDVAETMGVKWTVVSKWIKSGLLKPVASHANAVYFSRTEVERFKSEFIFTEQAARILCIGVLAVQKWARTGRLKPVAGPKVNGCHRYLFRRADVERLCPKNRLTAPQLAKHVGIGRNQMIRWIRQGKVKPVSGPGIDKSGQYLFLRDKLESYLLTLSQSEAVTKGIALSV